MKLSNKQKEVIELMRGDYELYTWKNEHHGSRGQLVYSARQYELWDGKTTKILHHSTVRGLMDKKLLNDKRPYHLTDKGKSIKL